MHEAPVRYLSLGNISLVCIALILDDLLTGLFPGSLPKFRASEYSPVDVGGIYVCDEHTHSIFVLSK